MNVNSLVIKQFEATDVFFVEDGWFNATLVAKQFGKDSNDWSCSDDAFQYGRALAKSLNLLNDHLKPEMIPDVDSLDVMQKRGAIQKFLKDADLKK